MPLPPRLNQLRRRLRRAARELRARLRPRAYLRASARVTGGLAGVEELRTLVPERRIEVPEVQRVYLRLQTAMPHDGTGFRLPALSSWVVPEGGIDLRTGVARTGAGVLLVDSAVDERRLVRTASYLDRRIAGTRHAGDVSSVWGIWMNSYFHWSAEGLFRLPALARVPRRIKLLMPERLTPLQAETLSLHKPDNVEVEHVPPGWITAERRVQVSYCLSKHCFFPPREFVDDIRDRAYARLPAAGKRRRIYVSRGDAAVRKIPNEAEIIAALARRGFESVQLSRLAYLEQVALFRDAEVVVAPHGAGLINLIYGEAPRVIELAGHVFAPTYFFLSLALGFPYSCVLGDAARGDKPEAANSDAYRDARSRDMRIDLAELERHLDATC